MMDDIDIETLLPQKTPFVMVGQLLHADSGTITSTYTIKENNVLVENGFFSEAGLLENIAQTAAAGAGYKAISENRDITNGYIGAVKNLEIFALPKVNDEIKTEVNEKGIVFNMQTIEGKVWLGEQLMAQCEMKLFLQEEA